MVLLGLGLARVRLHLAAARLVTLRGAARLAHLRLEARLPPARGPELVLSRRQVRLEKPLGRRQRRHLSWVAMAPVVSTAIWSRMHVHMPVHMHMRTSGMPTRACSLPSITPHLLRLPLELLSEQPRVVPPRA